MARCLRCGEAITCYIEALEIRKAKCFRRVTQEGYLSTLFPKTVSKSTALPTKLGLQVFIIERSQNFSVY
ncbi:MAG: hypothetical protein V7L20_18510 [Nostoc sp.]